MSFDENKPEPIGAPDTPNQTKFHPEEVTEPIGKAAIGFRNNYKYKSRKDQFDTLQRYNRTEGNKFGTKTTVFQSYDRKQRIDMISSHLELTNRQRRICRNMRELPAVRKLGFADEIVAFAICVMVFRYEYYAKNTPEDEREIYSPFRANREDNPERFLRVQDSFGITDKDLTKVVSRLRSKFPDFFSS